MAVPDLTFNLPGAISKEDLIQMIQNTDTDYFKFEHEETEQGNSYNFDIADMKTGCNYPPYGHEIVYVNEPSEHRWTLTFKDMSGCRPKDEK